MTMQFIVTVDTEGDTVPQNNRASGFVQVRGDPRVLVVSSDPEADRFLVQALRQARLEVRVVPETGLPSTLAEIQSHDAVVLGNVSAGDLGPDGMRLLESAVRDFGVGLVCVGGDQAFAAGGYRSTPLEEALPLAQNKLAEGHPLRVFAVMDILYRLGRYEAAAALLPPVRRSAAGRGPGSLEGGGSGALGAAPAAQERHPLGEERAVVLAGGRVEQVHAGEVALAALRGEAVFAQIECNTCHTPTMLLNARTFTEPSPFNTGNTILTVTGTASGTSDQTNNYSILRGVTVNSGGLFTFNRSDNIVWNNITSIGLTNDSRLYADHNIFGNTNWPGGGNFSADPLFVDPARRNYRLQPGSTG
mgnify:CR=1 FL=1